MKTIKAKAKEDIEKGMPVVIEQFLWWSTVRPVGGFRKVCRNSSFAFAKREIKNGDDVSVSSDNFEPCNTLTWAHGPRGDIYIGLNRKIESEK